MKKRQADVPRRDEELLVRFGPDVTEQGKEIVVSSKGARRKGRLRGESRLERLELQTGRDPAEVAEQLRGEPGVELAEPNFLVTRSQVTADDPRFGEQWVLKNTGQSGGVPGSDIGVANAWVTTTGSQSAVVAVVDSGMDFTHPDLRNNRWVNTCESDNGRDDDRNGFADDLHGWDWVAASGRVIDENGHGTAVAGIVAAQGNNGVGVSGVMWRASLMSLRVLDAGGTGDVAAAVEAIDYAASHGAQVINCSWGTDADSLALRDAVKRANRRGVVVVASAGNGSRDLDTRPYYPASFDLPNVVSVASSDQFDNLAPFSDWGAAGVTLAAPGIDILTTKAGGDYRLVSGTSASAPLVAGVAGLLKTQRLWLTAAATVQALVAGVRRVDTLAGKVAAGGVVNAAGSLNTLRGPYDPQPGPGSGNGNGNRAGNGNGQSVPTPRPPDPGRGRGNYRGTPPPASATSPAGGPDLIKLRDQPSYVPSGPPPQRIAGNAPPVCEDCYEASGSTDPQFSQSRSLPSNQTGEPAVDLGSKNFNWALPLVSLPGRAGLDLSLTLYYNSLVWVKQGNAYQFDADGGYPSPGFQLGFPRIQKPYANGAAYMLVTPSGGRVELARQDSTTYEAQDGFYAQLKLLANGWARVTTTDGTQYSFEPTANGEKRCREVKDRNGNYISVNYDWAGRVGSAVDTLGRQINFVYNGNGQLFRLTQDRAGSGHTDVLAQFDYSDFYMQPLFVNAAGSFVWPLGPHDAHVSMLSRVWVPDGTTHHFEYTLYGQVWKITRQAPDGHVLGYQWYDLPSSPQTAHITQTECPRFTVRHDFVEYGVMQANAETLTYFATDANNTVTQVTLPDGTVYKEFFDSGATEAWRKGLTIGSEVWSGGVPRKWTNISWTHDGVGFGSALNPRVTQMTLEDAEGNRRKTTVEYNQGFSLPTHVREYGKVGGQEVELRLTTTTYNLDAAYLGRRVIGLPSERSVTDSQTGRVVSKESYTYDWGGTYFSAQAPSVQYADPGVLAGRGNLTAVYRLNCPETGPATCQDAGSVWAARTGYNMAGSPVWQMDAIEHQTSISYSDSFSDTSKNGLGTLAYATAVTDPEGYQSTARYDYTTGAPTETRRPSSGTAAQGNVTYETRAFTYDWVARLQKAEVVNTGFYTRYEYPADRLSVKAFQNIQPGLENYSVEVLDGAGRVRRTAAYMPYSNGSFSGRQFYYDSMGRLAQWTNPTETDPNWEAYGADAVASGGFGWVSTSRAFDWQGRPRVTTYPDGSTTELTYGGCGCAGGDVVTSRDQRGRLKKMYRDTLGRLTKVEELNYDSSVYSTAATSTTRATSSRPCATTRAPTRAASSSSAP